MGEGRAGGTGDKSFNVAASIKMRKCAQGSALGCSRDPLQCGRIYKDAEILVRRAKTVLTPRLQCGRIYKDAEIRRRLLKIEVD